MHVFATIIVFYLNFISRGGIDFEKKYDHYFRNTPRPVATSSPKPTHKPHATSTPSPKPTFKPSASPSATPRVVKISSVVVHGCSNGSSCYSYLTGVEVNGGNFATDSRTKLISGSNIFTGTYMGGDGSTKIITDFIYLPHCTTFDVLVFGSTGNATASGTVSSICP